VTIRVRIIPLARLALLASCLAATGARPCSSADTSDDDPDDGTFGLSAPVACKEVRGFEDYEPLPDAALTADEKLLVYLRPRHYKVTREGSKYVAHLTQDGRIRRRGEKAVLWSKKNLLDYKAETDTPPGPIYLRNTVALKGLKPGEYDFEITLYDKIGQSAPAVRTLPFRVVAAPAPEKDEKDRDKAGTPNRPTVRPGPPA
jgi:hypothetical protein